MDRIIQVFTLIKPLAQDRFVESQALIERYCENNKGVIAAEVISAFKKAFIQAADLQREEEKGAVRYMILSHLYSSICTGGYSVKLDIFDRRLYADPHEIDVYLRLDWLSGFLAEDMEYFRNELAKRVPSLKGYEMEQIRYRYVYYYHSLALELLSESLPSILQTLEFQQLKVQPDFQVMFGGYMDKAVVIWPKAEVDEVDNEVFSA